MTRDQHLKQLRTAGEQAIANDGQHAQTQIPFEQDDVVLKQMFEYPVADFEAEVGFYVHVFGFPAIALTEDYALFKHPKHGYCISFRKVESSPAPSLNGLKLLFMTTDIPSADAHLEHTEFVHDREIRKGSPVQDVIYFSTPAGVNVEIWEMPVED